jgi:hypothetical protein
MFKSFLPKLCAIPASVVPISLMSVFGYIPPAFGVPQIQNDGVVTYLSTAFCLIPLMFALTSFYIKTKFIMKTNKQVEQIGVGIALHLLSPPRLARCPFSGAEIKLFKYADEERHWTGVIGHFPGVQKVELLLREGGIAVIQKECMVQQIYACISLITFAILAVSTTSTLMAGKLSFIPVLLIVGTGGNVIAVIFTFFRKAAARTIGEEMALPQSERTLTKDLLERILEEREMLNSVTKFKEIDPSGLNSKTFKEVDHSEIEF